MFFLLQINPPFLLVVLLQFFPLSLSLICWEVLYVFFVSTFAPGRNDPQIPPSPPSPPASTVLVPHRRQNPMQNRSMFWILCCCCWEEANDPETRQHCRIKNSRRRDAIIQGAGWLAVVVVGGLGVVDYHLEYRPESHVGTVAAAAACCFLPSTLPSLVCQ